MEEKPGSWSVLIATMALLYAISRWIASRVPYVAAPLFFLARFITNRYNKEIDLIGNWIKTRFSSFWKRLRIAV